MLRGDWRPEQRFIALKLAPAHRICVCTRDMGKVLEQTGGPMSVRGRKKNTGYFPSWVSWDLNEGNLALAILTPACSNTLPLSRVT